MPLNKPKLQEDIRKAFKEAQGATSAEQGLNIVSKKLSEAIDVYVRSGEVQTIVGTTGTGIVAPGQAVGSSISSPAIVMIGPGAPPMLIAAGVPLPGPVLTITDGASATVSAGTGVGKVV